MKANNDDDDGTTTNDTTKRLMICNTDNGTKFLSDDDVDHVIFTTQPSIIVDILESSDESDFLLFDDHINELKAIESGAVGVQICHEKDLPFSYPPPSSTSSSSSQSSNPICGYDLIDPPMILGIFDVSELTTRVIFDESKGYDVDKKDNDDDARRSQTNDEASTKAGWLSIAYPVYQDESLNRHEKFLSNIKGVIDKTIYPWIRPTSNYPAIRRSLQDDLQGLHGIYITGHTLNRDQQG